MTLFDKKKELEELENESSENDTNTKDNGQREFVEELNRRINSLYSDDEEDTSDLEDVSLECKNSNDENIDVKEDAEEKGASPDCDENLNNKEDNIELLESIDTSRKIFTDDNATLPVIALRGVTPFPAIQMTTEIVRPISLKAFTAAATSNDSKVVLIAQKNITEENPTEKDFFRIGVIAEIKHVVKNAQGNLSVVFEGLSRARLISMHTKDEYLLASVRPLEDTDKIINEKDPRIVALMLEVKAQLKKLLDIHPTFTEDLLVNAEAITKPGYLCDFTASSALIDYKNKQKILETMDPERRLVTLLECLGEEAMLLETEHDIQVQVRDKIDKSQKDYFLREQMRAIQEELGDNDDDELDEYETKIEAANLPEEVKEKLMKELNRLSKTPFGAAESTVIRTYLDTCLEFPFNVYSKEEANVEEAKEILNKDHDGLEKVKERILEFVAVKQFSPHVKSQIICLVGPPGVGKTSVAASVARALHRKYARVSLGGMHDEAEIRGHRKTYVGAMPGRIVTALINAKAQNPVIVLDEIDKMANDFRGDPTSALLEVLDPEQNKSFRDNFMEFPIDLSDTMFIATANSYEGIPSPLLDRMEIIELSTYTDSEKVAIAKNHLIPKQLAANGMTSKMWRITENGLLTLIRGYTREAGVRNLERELASLMRKGAKKIAETGKKSVIVTEKNISEYLGKIKVIPEKLEKENSIGVVNGLAYTQAGGDLLKVEVAALEGQGKIELTGSLGDVMKESAKIAHSYVRSVAKEYNIPTDFYKTTDLHIHFPEGAIPKDGPSAGVTMVTAIVSALSGTPVRRDIAMTGEVTLRGKVLPIGGLKEKTLAAYRSGVKTVLIPEENVRDLDDIDKEAREHLEFIPCSTCEDVLKNALVK